jgi:hypothetical protein
VTKIRRRGVSMLSNSEGVRFKSRIWHRVLQLKLFVFLLRHFCQAPNSASNQTMIASLFPVRYSPSCLHTTLNAYCASGAVVKQSIARILLHATAVHLAWIARQLPWLPGWQVLCALRAKAEDSAENRVFCEIGWGWRNSWASSILNPWSRGLSENLSGPRVLRKFPEFYGTRRFITTVTRAGQLSLSWARSI